MEITALDTFNINSTTATTSTTDVSGSALESLSTVDTKSYINSSAFFVDVSFSERIDSVSTAFSAANLGVGYSQVTNKSLSYQNDLLESVKNKLILAQKNTTTDEGREILRNEISDILTTFDKIASEGNYNDMYFMQNSSTDDSASIVYSFQISEFPEITISNESIRSNTQGLGLDTLKDLAEDGLTSAVASTQSTVVDDAITSIEGFQEDYQELQSRLKMSVSSLNEYYTKLKTERNDIKEVNYAAESADFDKSKILSQFGQLATSQANATQSIIGSLLSSIKSSSFSEFSSYVSSLADTAPTSTSTSTSTTSYSTTSAQ
ncbi:MAG: hypothetical protein KAQ94_09850 [Arcobacteraceae bacterium]|nr:hypothetical protein [Arcobacteraceae bacterium]